MNHFIRGAAALAFVVGLLQAVSGAHAQGAVAQVRVSPASNQILVGQTAQAAVEVVGVQGLYGVDITLTFDPRVVEVVTPPGASAPVAQGTFLDSGLVVLNRADNTAGIVRYAMTQMNPSEPRNGSGTLIVLTLRGKQAGSTSPLTLTKVDLAQRDGFMITDTLTAGQISVAAAGDAPTASPLPAQAATAVPAQAQPSPGTMQLAATPTSQPPPAPQPATPLPAAPIAAATALAAAQPSPTAPAQAAPAAIASATPRVAAAASPTVVPAAPLAAATATSTAAVTALAPTRSAAAIAISTGAPSPAAPAPTAVPAQEVAARQPDLQPAGQPAPQSASADTQWTNPFQPLGVALGLCGGGFVVLGVLIALLFAVAGRAGAPAGQRRSN